MNLAKKKLLASRALNVGVHRLIFNNSRLAEINEAITKQDIRDLLASGAIHISTIKGVKKNVKRKTRRRQGSIRKRVIDKKRVYMTRTRKLRSYLFDLRAKGQITPELYTKIRKEIKSGAFKDKNHFKERIKNG